MDAEDAECESGQLSASASASIATSASSSRRQSADEDDLALPAFPPAALCADGTSLLEEPAAAAQQVADPFHDIATSDEAEEQQQQQQYEGVQPEAPGGEVSGHWPLLLPAHAAAPASSSSSPSSPQELAALATQCDAASLCDLLSVPHGHGGTGVGPLLAQPPPAQPVALLLSYSLASRHPGLEDSSNWGATMTNASLSRLLSSGGSSGCPHPHPAGLLAAAGYGTLLRGGGAAGGRAAEAWGDEGHTEDSGGVGDTRISLTGGCGGRREEERDVDDELQEEGEGEEGAGGARKNALAAFGFVSSSAATAAAAAAAAASASLTGEEVAAALPSPALTMLYYGPRDEDSDRWFSGSLAAALWGSARACCAPPLPPPPFLLHAASLPARQGHTMLATALLRASTPAVSLGARAFSLATGHAPATAACQGTAGVLAGLDRLQGLQAQARGEREALARWHRNREAAAAAAAAAAVAGEGGEWGAAMGGGRRATRSRAREAPPEGHLSMWLSVAEWQELLLPK